MCLALVPVRAYRAILGRTPVRAYRRSVPRVAQDLSLRGRSLSSASSSAFSTQLKTNMKEMYRIRLVCSAFSTQFKTVVLRHMWPHVAHHRMPRTTVRPNWRRRVSGPGRALHKRMCAACGHHAGPRPHVAQDHHAGPRPHVAQAVPHAKAAPAAQSSSTQSLERSPMLRAQLPLSHTSSPCQSRRTTRGERAACRAAASARP